MSDTEWATWVSFHSAMFSFQGRRDVAMFAAWREAFELRRYTAEELRAASLAMSADPPKYRRDHLGRIHGHIREERRRAKAVEVQSPQIYKQATEEDWRRFREARKAMFKRVNEDPKGDAWEGTA